MNVLVLTMSTLPGKIVNGQKEISPCKYTYKFRTPIKDQLGSIEFSGFSQLEPVIIALIYKLANRGDRLDYVLAINNSETYDDIYNIILQNDEKSTYYSLSAFDFLKERVNNYPFDSIEFKPRESYSKFEASENITSPEFKSIKVDYRNPINGVSDICNEIRELYNKCEKKRDFKLLLDIHGGIRAQQTIVDSVLYLLENEGIKISETYSVEGAPPNINIINADESIKILDFVSGMNEFLNYGRSKSLISYFQSNLAKPTNINEDQNLVDAISKVSESLLLCRMDEFGMRLGRLGEALEGLPSEENSELATFAGTIMNDYGLLLQDENNIPAQLKWCLKHEFLQQALTIIESMVPSYLLDKKVIWYEYLNAKKRFEKLTDDTSDKINKEKSIYTELFIPKWKVNQGQRREFRTFPLVDFIRDSRPNGWTENENHLFESCTRAVQFKNRLSIPLELEEDSYHKIPFKWYKNRDTREEEDILPTKYEFRFIGKIQNSSNNQNARNNMREWKSNISLVVDEKNREMFNRMLQLHWTLKNQRNLANHARPVKQKEDSNQNSREDVEKIKVAIKVYADMLNTLICSCER